MRIVICLRIAVVLAALSSCSQVSESAAEREPVVEELVRLLETRADLTEALAEAITAADVEGVDSLEAFYGYVNELVTWIPVEREIVPKVVSLHYIINQAPEDATPSAHKSSAQILSSSDHGGQE